MTTFGRLAACALAAGAVLGVTAGAVSAEGPPEEVFADNDGTWLCHEDPGSELPPHHCLNARSQGDTLVLHVFAPDPRWPQESASFDPKADTRPCPHDPDADPDGTWWEVGDGLYACHHRP